MRVTSPGQKAIHLGDGAYAEFDGVQIWVKAEREHGWEGVALDRHALRALVEYARTITDFPR